MNILWLAWKDTKHTEAGGAEVVGDELRKRLVADGHTVTLLTARPKDMAEEDEINGYHIVRVGGKFSVYWKAYRYYKTHLRGKFDLVIEEINTIPFFSRFYIKERSFLFFHQLAREVWFYQMMFPLSLVGYLLEPLYLRLISDADVLTISESTKRDLSRYGFSRERIMVISEGSEIAPVEKLEPKGFRGHPHMDEIQGVGKGAKKAYNDTMTEPQGPHNGEVRHVQMHTPPTVLSLGAVRPMKRTLDIVKAFEILKASMPEAKLVIAGDMTGSYGDKVSAYIAASAVRADIHVLGRISKAAKLELYRAVQVLAVTSIKEGWGLVVTEANTQGTPAAVYNVDGLRDSVKNTTTGAIALENTPAGLAKCIEGLLKSKPEYERIRKNAWEWSKKITFDQQYQDFKKIIKI